MVSVAAQDIAAGKDLETQRSGLFVSLERRIDGALEFAQEIEAEEHGQESRFGGKEGTQAEMIGSQLVLEFVNATLYGGTAGVIAPDFQRCIATISDKEKTQSRVTTHGPASCPREQASS
jgi:hypothetical protein